jgi:hypothetical protein
MANKINPASSATAPFVYADGVAALGVQGGGIIKIELAAYSIIPEGDGTKNELLVVAHLRCSTEAAKAIRDALDRALAMPSVEVGMMPKPAAARPN